MQPRQLVLLSALLASFGCAPTEDHSEFDGSFAGSGGMPGGGGRISEPDGGIRDSGVEVGGSGGTRDAGFDLGGSGGNRDAGLDLGGSGGNRDAGFDLGGSGGNRDAGFDLGGSGGGGGSSDGGAGGYRPCPTSGDPCRILPLGDSITWGIQYDGAYRVQLFSKAVAAGQNITFTGSVSNGPTTVAGKAFPRSNEGHSGWTISQIAGLVPSPAFNTIPHIVLLMIGTNDVYAASGQSTMPDRLGSLMDKVFTAAPNALLVVAKITPLSTASWNATIKTYNDAIPGLVQARAAAGKHVVLADMNTGFASSMLSTDGVHPNKSGYDFMGDRWYAIIKDLLP